MNTITYKHHNAGVGLVEVLVTLIVLSIGLLGLAALQLTGLRSNSGAESRSTASMLASDIADRMRANPTAVDNNDFSNIDTTNISCLSPPVKQCGDYYDGSAHVTATSCTADQMATYDLKVWYCGTTNGTAQHGGFSSSLTHPLLPSGRATINCNDSDPSDADACTNGSTHTITVSWTPTNPDINKNTAGTTTQPTQHVTLTITP